MSRPSVADKASSRFHNGGTIALLSTRARPYGRDDCPLVETRVSDGGGSHKVRLARGVEIPPRTQVCVSVVTETSGICCVEGNARLYEKHNVLSANAVVEVVPNKPFSIHLANWGNAPRRLCKRTIVGYAQRKPPVLACTFVEGGGA